MEQSELRLCRVLILPIRSHHPTLMCLLFILSVAWSQSALFFFLDFSPHENNKESRRVERVKGQPTGSPWLRGGKSKDEKRCWWAESLETSTKGKQRVRRSALLFLGLYYRNFLNYRSYLYCLVTMVIRVRTWFRKKKCIMPRFHIRVCSYASQQ